MQDINITLVQTKLSWENPAQNLANFDSLLSKIQDTDLVILPEMFNTGFTMNAENCGEPPGGKTISWLKNKANQLNCVVSGSLLFKDENKYFNRFIWMRPDGSSEFYDKRHLFRMSREHHTISQGTEKKIVTLNNWKINLQVCYDLRFPVWSKNNYSDDQFDYDLLLYVANWPEIRKVAYTRLLPARAIENQAYVIWVNRIGTDGHGINHSGDSMVLDPYGNIKQIAGANTEEIIQANLSFVELKEFRKKFQVGRDWDSFKIK